MNHTVRGPRIVVMGVTGSGKTTTGGALAARLGLPYADADDFHPVANLAKMSAGEPLDDRDRSPWLRAIGAWLATRPGGCIVSCSALRRSYRDLLRRYASDVVFLHLSGDADVVTARVAARTGHFMPASLVSSQVDLLEPLQGDEPGTVADLRRPVEELITEFAQYVQDRRPLPAAPSGGIR